MNCIEGNRQIIEQIIKLLEVIDNQIYAKPLDIFKGSTLGQHFRHILDFYLCLLKGTKSGVIDYANRDRDPAIESDAQYAKTIFQRVSDSIIQLLEADMMQVYGDFSNQSYEQRPLLQSSIGRELMFAHDHAVHHLAMIKVGIDVIGVPLNIDSNVGVAPSTIKHRYGAHASGENGY
ncbi:MAG: hypothetical protein SFU99_24115 [Saprospiraceae bacterium]|nr:hypothetical protein [Saprospiraceae bacterium]